MGCYLVENCIRRLCGEHRRVKHASGLHAVAWQPFRTFVIACPDVDAILANDAELKALFEHTLAQGFEYYGNATLQTLRDGTE